MKDPGLHVASFSLQNFSYMRKKHGPGGWKFMEDTFMLPSEVELLKAEMAKNLNLFSERNALRAKAFSFKDPIRVTDLKHLDDLNTAKETTKATLRDKAKFERRYTEEKRSMLRKSALENDGA